MLEDISEQQRTLSGGLMRLLDLLEKDKDSEGPSLNDILKELVTKIDHLTWIIQGKTEEEFLIALSPTRKWNANRKEKDPVWNWDSECFSEVRARILFCEKDSKCFRRPNGFL